MSKVEWLFAGQLTSVHPFEKNGVTKIGVTDPEYPAIQGQPVGTLTPALREGQDTAKHDSEKKGVTEVGVTVPSYPALHEHPSGTVPRIVAGTVVCELW